MEFRARKMTWLRNDNGIISISLLSSRWIIIFITNPMMCKIKEKEGLDMKSRPLPIFCDYEIVQYFNNKTLNLRF